MTCFKNSVFSLLVLTAIVDLMVHADPSPMCISGLPLSCYARPILLAALLTSMSLFCAVYIHFSYPVFVSTFHFSLFVQLSIFFEIICFIYAVVIRENKLPHWKFRFYYATVGD